jgi:hypothetical protein
MAAWPGRCGNPRKRRATLDESFFPPSNATIAASGFNSADQTKLGADINEQPEKSITENHKNSAKSQSRKNSKQQDPSTRTVPAAANPQSGAAPNKRLRIPNY